MNKLHVYAATAAVLASLAKLPAATVEFNLVTHTENRTLLPQPKATPTVAGDHLLRTGDDITDPSYNPGGCFSFNFTNPVGESQPDYPPGYAEGIHSMTGCIVLDIDLAAGGSLSIDELAFDGFITSTKSAYQWLVRPGDPATNGDHGDANGGPNDGTYAPGAQSNWALAATFDWYYDTPFQQHPSIDMTFNDYQWNGFIIPVEELTPAGMAATVLDDPLGYYGGTSEDFESWLLAEVAPRLGADARYVMFAQGEAHPDWTHPMMGMTTEGIVGQTVIAYAVPEPGTMLFFAAGFCGLAVTRRARAARSRDRNRSKGS